MATLKQVKVLEVFKVTPISRLSDSSAPTSLSLTLFDLFWLRVPPNRRLFFYEAPFSLDTITSIIIPKLKYSLSVTLQHYLPLAGNLTWPQDSDKPFVQRLEDDTVSLIIAESRAEFFNHFVGDNFRRADDYDPLLPCLHANDMKVPVMALQITLFPNIGFCIGYAIHHAVMDGKTTSMFMHSWASICRRGGDTYLNPELSPFYDRTFANNMFKMEKACLQGWLDKGGPNNKTLKLSEFKAPIDTMYGTFLMTKASIEKIKKLVHGRWHEGHENKSSFHLSSYTITCAFVWVCLVKAHRISTKKVHIVISANCRSRLEPPIPSTYFGNCVFFRMAEAITEDLMGEDGIMLAAQSISEAIESFRDEVMNGANEWTYKLFSTQTNGKYGVAGSASFEHYNTNFGWGRPMKVELVSIDKSGTFSFSDCKYNDGGVEVGIALTKPELEAFASLFVSSLVKCACS